MVEKLSGKIVRYLESRGIIECDYEVYEYGFNLIIYELINLLGILIISIFLEDVSNAILYIIIFTLFRALMGGYHEKTRIRCFISTMSLYIGFVFILKNITFLKSKIFILLFITSLIVLWLTAPVDTIKHRILLKKKLRLKIIDRSICLFLLSTFVYLSCIHYESQLFYVVELICIYSGVLCLIQFYINNQEGVK
ncbi:MAG: accessory gene regulator B family protein [Anaerorhabdus sp.]|uniref:accessory gene regulator B family protein n=1 Tax=Anaerorhabdus sp. TaxID=1872524 RepID=UPI002FC5857F